MASMARALILPEGREPALKASTRPAPCRRAKASAIWLRLLFSTQTKRIRIGSSPARRTELLNRDAGPARTQPDRDWASPCRAEPPPRNADRELGCGRSGHSLGSETRSSPRAREA